MEIKNPNVVIHQRKFKSHLRFELESSERRLRTLIKSYPLFIDLTFTAAAVEYRSDTL